MWSPPYHNELLSLFLFVQFLDSFQPHIRSLESESVPLEQNRVTAGPVQHYVSDHSYNKDVFHWMVLNLKGVVKVGIVVSGLVGVLKDLQADE